ncbi:hypothetical protein Syun_029430 [Stephania yunnanensis]|uniref:Uncharacterized protein n=1 Tax=Stephania yunnanensis TaxID=152371 RepID=A0AAP0E5L3_9MAGN
MLAAPLTALCSSRTFSPSLTALEPTFPSSLSPKSFSQTLNLCRHCDRGCDEAVGSAGALVAIKQQAFTSFRAANTSSIREVAELYGSEKSFVVKVQRALSGLRTLYRSYCSGEAKLQRKCPELTQATPNQPVDDEVVYLNVAGEYPKRRVYGLGFLGRKKRRYADPGASTFLMPEMVPRAEFNIVAEQLRKFMAFMHQQFGMTMDGAGLSQPPPPPPHDQQQPPQIDPVDPPQQHDNVSERCKIGL